MKHRQLIKFILTNVVVSIIFFILLAVDDLVNYQRIHVSLDIKIAVASAVVIVMLYDIHYHIRHKDDDDDDTPPAPGDLLVANNGAKIN